MMSRSRWVFAMALAIAMAALCPGGSLGAQQADVIRGRVSASGTDEALVGAAVTATTLSGGVNRQARTDGRGRYTITFPGGEGDYIITIRAIGYVPRRFELAHERKAVVAFAYAGVEEDDRDVAGLAVEMFEEC